MRELLKILSFRLYHDRQRLLVSWRDTSRQRAIIGRQGAGAADTERLLLGFRASSDGDGRWAMGRSVVTVTVRRSSVDTRLAFIIHQRVSDPETATPDVLTGRARDSLYNSLSQLLTQKLAGAVYIFILTDISHGPPDSLPDVPVAPADSGRSDIGTTHRSPDTRAERAPATLSSRENPFSVTDHRSTSPSPETCPPGDDSCGRPSVSGPPSVSPGATSSDSRLPSR